MSRPAFSIYDDHGLRGIPHKLRISRILRTLGQFDLRGKKYADVGCYDGYVTAKIIDQIQPAHASGYDFDPKALARGQARYPNIDFRQMNINAPVKPPETYDLVTCFETLEHVVQIETAVYNLLSLAAPRAILLVTVPVEIGVVGAMKFLAKTIVWRESLERTFVNSKPTNREYFLTLLAGKDISRFRAASEGVSEWPTHFGFSYRRIDQILRKEKIQFTVSNHAGNRMYLIHP